MLKPAGVKRASRVDLGALDNVKSAFLKNYYMGVKDQRKNWYNIGHSVLEVSIAY